MWLQAVIQFTKKPGIKGGAHRASVCPFLRAGAFVEFGVVVMWGQYVAGIKNGAPPHGQSCAPALVR